MFITEKKFLIFLLSISILFSIQLFAQDNCGGSKSKKAKKYFDKGFEALQYRDYKKAHENLLAAIEEDENYVDAYFALAQIKLERADRIRDDWRRKQEHDRLYALGIKYFKTIADICPEYYDGTVLYEIADYYYTNRQYKEALPYIKQFITVKGANPIQKKRFEHLAESIESFFTVTKTPVPFEPKPVNGVCTGDGEYLPLLSPDGEIFFFTRQSTGRTKNDVAERSIENFMFSEKLPDAYNDFSNAKPMPTPFNLGEGDQGGVTISIDNKHLYVTICRFLEKGDIRFGARKDCDLYVSHLVNGKWTKLKNLGENVNSKSWDSQPSLSADGKTLYFSSYREDPDAKGGLDLWMIEKQNDDTWSKPKNLGNIINTEGNEKSPFIHSDSKTLYFASDGHPGIGGYDIFYSKMNENGEWSIPTNIGVPINTKNDDVSFFVSLDGKKGYFASNSLTNNDSGYDVYSFDLYEGARPKKVLFLKGQLLNDDGKPVTDATIELKNTLTNETTQAMVDSSTGEYAVAVTIESEEDIAALESSQELKDTTQQVEIKENKELFILKAKKPGYAYVSEVIDLKEPKFEKPAKIDFKMEPVEVGKPYRLNNINFATNSADLTKETINILNDFIEFLQENPNIKIAIHGHTDNVGNDGQNLQLSEDRAKSVHDYLLINDITKERLSYKGFGETKPVATNDTPEGRAKNRRTEFVIMDK